MLKDDFILRLFKRPQRGCQLAQEGVVHSLDDKLLLRAVFCLNTNDEHS